MRNQTRFAAISGAVVAATLAACANPTLPTAGQTYPGPSYPVYSSTTPYPTAPAANYPVAGVEYGRITNIEFIPPGTTTTNNHNVLGAIVGGVAGAALGSQIGGGTGRTAATVLGGAAGAVIGSQIARNAQGATAVPGYRVTVQTDQGIWRTYEVTSTGDLRVGDRVRVDNGVIYRG